MHFDGEVRGPAHNVHVALLLGYCWCKSVSFELKNPICALRVPYPTCLCHSFVSHRQVLH